ncbi:Nn.00g098330.m01.CDS01 [Neocucurbitaria sp. VM-36]
MSGVELALAIVPLVIAVIQHRKPLAKAGRAILTSNRSNEQRNERSDFYSQLYIELSMLHNTLQKLVGDVPPTDNEAMQKRIHQALSTGAKVFEDILRDILQSVDDIVSDRSLGLEGMVRTPDTYRSTQAQQASQKLQRTMLARLEFIKEAAQNPDKKQSLRERFRLTKNEKSQKVAMKRIRAGNDRLFMLVYPFMEHDSQRSRTPRRTGSAPARLSPSRSRKIWEPSYRRLAKKWPKGCCSPFHHQARLSLRSCCSSQQNPLDGINMRISVPGEVGKGPIWQEMSMTALQDKSVRFADGGGVQTSSPNPPRWDIESKSLCSLLHEALDNDADLRIALEKEKLWQLKSGLAEWKIRQQNGTRLTSFLPDAPQGWELRERSMLAVILAHAVLHCLDSPWLCNNWSKDHVVFFRKDSSAEIEFEHPFLMIDFQEENVDPSPDNLMSVHGNPIILALGILLLEIFTQTGIESQREEQHLSGGQPNANTDLTTAIKVLKARQGDVRVKYRQAVWECLNWKDAQLDDDSLRQEIYEKIVEPLEHELSAGWPETENLYNNCEQCTAI